MKYIISKSQEAKYNLALEEFLLKNKDEDFFILYKNTDSIIVGKHQNTLAEINFELLKELKIPVVRRLSGGGTVFHDLGNLNYSIIIEKEDRNLVDFKKYSKPIIEVLQKLNVDAKFEGKSDLTIKGMKFSGNACHIYRNKVMQHGTLLFNSNLSRLNSLLKTNPLKFKDNGVRSIRSKVTNISDHINSEIDIDLFAKKIMEKIAQDNSAYSEFIISKEDNIEIENLVKEKYDTWDWNYAYSPKYKLEKILKTKTGKYIETFVNIKKGIISEIEIFIQEIPKEKLQEICDSLIGTKHKKEITYIILKNHDIEKISDSIKIDDLLNSIY